VCSLTIYHVCSPYLSSAAHGRSLSPATKTGVLAAPAASDGGTNLLVRRPPTAIPARFGRSSFARHRGEAYRLGVTFQEVRIPELSFDLDRPPDLAQVAAGPRNNRTRAVC